MASSNGRNDKPEKIVLQNSSIFGIEGITDLEEEVDEPKTTDRDGIRKKAKHFGPEVTDMHSSQASEAAPTQAVPDKSPASSSGIRNTGIFSLEDAAEKALETVHSGNFETKTSENPTYSSAEEGSGADTGAAADHADAVRAETEEQKVETGAAVAPVLAPEPTISLNIIYDPDEDADKDELAEDADEDVAASGEVSADVEADNEDVAASADEAPGENVDTVGDAKAPDENVDAAGEIPAAEEAAVAEEAADVPAAEEAAVAEAADADAADQGDEPEAAQAADVPQAPEPTISLNITYDPDEDANDDDEDFAADDDAGDAPADEPADEDDEAADADDSGDEDEEDEPEPEPEPEPELEPIEVAPTTSTPRRGGGRRSVFRSRRSSGPRMPQVFTDEVYVDDATLAFLYRIFPADIAPMESLQQDWEQALANKTVRIEDDAIHFTTRFLSVQEDASEGMRAMAVLERIPRMATGKSWKIALVDSMDASSEIPEAIELEGLKLA